MAFDLLDVPWVIFHVKTSGMRILEEDHITEVGIVRLKTGRITDRILLSTEEMKGALLVPEDTIVPRVFSFAPDALVLFTHHAPFQMQFLAQSYYSGDEEPGNDLVIPPVVDVASLARRAFGELPSASLPILMGLCGIKDVSLRTALDRATANAMVCFFFLRILRNENIRTMGTLIDAFGSEKFPRSKGELRETLPLEHQEMVDKAIKERHRLRITYETTGGPLTGVVTPHRIWTRAGKLILDAYSLNNMEDRSFPMTEISRYELIERE